MFEKVFVVGLDRAKDRVDEFFNGIPSVIPFSQPELWQAIDGKKCNSPGWWTWGNGAWGCYKSHLNIIEHCLNNDIESVLIFEDDAYFVDGFDQKCREFMASVPDDWGMIYLGGQFLNSKTSPPKPVNDNVFIPMNVNRTHAFAIHRRAMSHIYRHLNETKGWIKNHHIDHHLGRLHQNEYAKVKPKCKVYCPKEWLVGQREGKSLISGKTLRDRVWLSAKSYHPDIPFVMVLGLHSSGSSCLAGVLHHLGVHVGNKLVGYWGYEAAGLARLCEQAIPFGKTRVIMSEEEILRRVCNWTRERRMEAAGRNTIAGGKYPQMCRLANIFKRAIGENLIVIDIHRPLEDSIESIVRRERSKIDPAVLEAHQRWLWEGKQKFLAENDHFRVDYYDLLKDPRSEVERIAEFLGLEPTESAIRVVSKPNKKEGAEAIA